MAKKKSGHQNEVKKPKAAMLGSGMAARAATAASKRNKKIKEIAKSLEN